MKSPAGNHEFAHADLDGRPAAGRSRRPASSPFGIDGAAAAADQAIRAAWAADDAGEDEAAAGHRLVAAWALRGAIRDGRGVNGNLAADCALLADLLRRAGEFGASLGASRRGLRSTPPPGVGALLRFQVELATAGDTARHHLGEAIAAAEPS